MTEARIFDLKKSGDVIIDFAAFLKELIEVENDVSQKDWEIEKGAYGYGDKICAIEDELENKSFITVSPHSLVPILLEGTQYFNNVVIKLCNSNIEFGLSDSTFYFLRGNEAIIEKIIKRFHNTAIEKK